MGLGPPTIPGKQNYPSDPPPQIIMFPGGNFLDPLMFWIFIFLVTIRFDLNGYNHFCRHHPFFE